MTEKAVTTILLLWEISKIPHYKGLPQKNGIVYYLSVYASSMAVTLISVKLHKLLTEHKLTKILKIFNLKSDSNNTKDRAWIEIDLAALEHNVKVLQSVLPKKCAIMAIVKANAYGHGDYMIASHLNRLDIDAFGVATIDEGINLRKHGIKGDILILGYTDPKRINELRRYRLMQTVIDYDYAKALNMSGKPVQVHIKIDTGMHRIGLHADETDKIAELFTYPGLDIRGIFTHLCVADSLTTDDVEYTKKQINTFYNMIERLKNKGIAIPKIHFQSSYGMLNYPDLYGDYVRIGIALYGTLSSPQDRTNIEIDLHPVLSLKARIAMLQRIARGESVGYGRDFTAERDSILAVIPIGYADGMPRNLSCENGGALIHGHYAPIVGRVCMDQLLVDVTDIPGVKTGDIATLIGKDEDNEISAADIAYHCNTITNELLSRLGTRLKRIYIH